MNLVFSPAVAAQGILIAMSVLVTFVPAVTQAADRFAGFDSYVGAAMEKWQVPGLAIEVIKDGETVLTREFGECEIGTGRKVRFETAFLIASCSKSFTAAALALLVDEGKVSWDDPVVKHLQSFELSDPYRTEHATVRDLLSHRTGLLRADLLQDGTGFDQEEISCRLKYLESAAAFRTRLIYNNHTYTILNQLVDRVSGQPFEKFLDERLFQPLNIKLPTSLANELPRHRLALRHWRSDAGIVARDVSQTDGIYLTASDMSRWLKLHLGEGIHNGSQLIKPDTVREMHALQFSEPVKFRPKNNVYAAQFYGAGLGWFVQDYRGRKVVLHRGAWGASMGMIPEERLGVVVLTNLDLESLAPMLMYDVFDAYLVGAEHAWEQEKWDLTWLRNEPPGFAYRSRDAARTRLEKTQEKDTRPSLPLKKYAGHYESPLYGSLIVRQERDQLLVQFGEHATIMSHWQNDSFYARSPTRLTFDWLLTFAVPKGGDVSAVTIKHIGWDKDEKDHVFTNTCSGSSRPL